LNGAVSNQGAMGKGVRRRRSWYRRRLRIQRTFIVLLVAVLAGACLQSASRLFSSHPVRASQVLPDSFWRRANLHKDLAFAAALSVRPVRARAHIPSVYPYSVIPGGVSNTADLRHVATSDYVVRRHYANFDFAHARLERAREAREVYLSYRIRNTVFWTRKRVRLYPGELLLTDGNITARARCGNQISETPKPEVSDEEPDEDVLDRPVTEVASAPSMPIHPMLAPPDLPVGEPAAPTLFAGAFIFPYVPVNVPIPTGLCPPGDQKVDGRCVPKRKKTVVPEPSTLLLIVPGLALVGWRCRKQTRVQTA
jgi:PEP-CTERM motif-containing protein